MITESPFTLPTPDGKTIYGLKNSNGVGAKAAIFIAHGLNCSMYDYHIKRAADHFPTLGFDVYRINFYDGRKNSRMLTDCTLATHAEDFNTLIQAFHSSYQKVFAIGHSYGGATIMLANPAQLTAACLWDPSYNIAQLNKDFASKKNDFHGYIRQDWGTSILLGKPMHEHGNTLDEPTCINLSKAFHAPIHVVFAGDGYYVNKKLNYHSYGNPLNSSSIVPGTTHCFHEGNTCEELLTQTYAWFKQFQS